MMLILFLVSSLFYMNSQTFLLIDPKTVGRDDLNLTGKILLPQFVLDKILNSNFQQQVMFFTLRNPKTKQVVGAGVESFTADSASCVVPLWMMEAIGLFENDKVMVTYTDFPSAKNVIFQPLTSDFNKLTNPKVILEHGLRQIPCLTQGTTIPIEFNNKIYKIKVLKSEPVKITSIIHADVITDFATPLDAFTHQWGEEEEENDTKKAKPKAAFEGKSHTLKD